MKAFSVLTMMVLLSLSPVFASCDDDDDKRINYEQTPTELKQFVSAHFDGVGVRYVEVDRDSYDVHLKNGFDLDFDLQGNWTEVDANRKDMPQSVIDLLPAKATEYINQNFVGRKIESIGNKAYGYKVDLVGNPDVEMVFDKDGNFQRYDD